MRQLLTRLSLGALILMLTPQLASAQTDIYDINWSVASGGGATFVSGGTNNVGNTIAQPVSNNTLPFFGGIYTLSIGFWFERLAGDANGDGCVNDSDLLIVLFNFGGTGQGDLNQDGIVNDTDLLLVLTNYGSGCQ